MREIFLLAFVVGGHILAAKDQIDLFDHITFPGVVERSSIGAAVIASLSNPFVYLNSLLFHYFQLPKLNELLIVRLVMGLVYVAVMFGLGHAVQKRFGQTAGRLFLIITSSQFHINYYCSRTLPNSFALILVIRALTYILSEIPSKTSKWIDYFVSAIVIFRIELVLWFVPLFIANEYYRNVSEKSKSQSRVRSFIVQTVGAAISGVLALIATVGFDSWFWGHLTWPEFSSIIFNIVENKSKNYGVQPFHYYFTVVLSKLLMLYYPILTFGLPRIYRQHSSDFKALLWPTMTFITLYSLLGHKELRFIMYTVLVFNIFLAIILDRIWKWNVKFSKAFVILLIIGNAAVSFFMLTASSFNYPGGHAVEYLNANINSISSANQNHTIICHMDVFVSMTGFSRFGQEYTETPYNTYSRNISAIYDKNENIINPSKYDEYDIVVVHMSTFNDNRLEERGFQTVKTIKGFSHVSVVKKFSQWKLLKYEDFIQIFLLKINLKDEVVIANKRPPSV